jgi:hypothetical protein
MAALQGYSLLVFSAAPRIAEELPESAPMRRPSGSC